MKRVFLVLHFAICLSTQLLQAQNALNTTGHSLKNNDKTFAYSVGEVTAFPLNTHCIYTPGVIQPAKISVKAPEQKLFDNYHEALIYPNPTTGIVLIETNDPDIKEYSVSQYDGKIVQSGKFNYISINIQRLQPGLYLITLYSADQKRKQTYKIIKL